MVTSNRIAEVASAIGDPARAAMLATLMDGRALTATELAAVAGVTPQTASTHLGRLLAAALLKVERQGRHRYHRLANADVARLLEQMMQHASRDMPQPRALRVGPRDDQMRAARTCYDHLAGRIAVAIADRFIREGYVEIDDDAGAVTPRGERFFVGQGLMMPGGSESRRPMCRPCLDWSERRTHLGGRLGAAICQCGFDQGWFQRRENSRSIIVTPKGHRALRERLGVRVG